MQPPAGLEPLAPGHWVTVPSSARLAVWAGLVVWHSAYALSGLPFASTDRADGLVSISQAMLPVGDRNAADVAVW